MLIPINQIAIINRQRKEIDVDKLKELAASIQANGLFHPIVIRHPFDHERSLLAAGQLYVLSMGGRRLAAHLLLGRSDVEANFKENLDAVTAEICELDENIKRANLTWQEEQDARMRIRELLLKQDPTLEDKQIAQELDISPAQLSKDVKLQEHIKKDPTLKQATSKGSALRTVEHKLAIHTRIKNVSVDTRLDLDNRIFTGDSRSFIRTIPSQSIDLVFSDLPYGIDYYDTLKDANVATTKGHYDDSPESAKDFIADIVPQCLRVVKPTGWVVFFMCYEWHGWLQELIHDTCNLHYEYVDPETRRCTKCVAPSSSFRPELPPWIWTRRGKGNHGHWPELHASNRYEMLVVVNGGQAKLTKKPVENVLDFPPFEGPRLHAMQKPHALCREIIERTTVIGEKVLDVCYGSGAHLAAAADCARDFVGCDSNPDNRASAISLVSQYYRKDAMEAVLKGRQNG